ncbi:MAG: AzlD domain-containing protein [Pseudomonadota bacterium]|nr:AzlD domain-containing protein [Pseudomonadota bacterium]
MTNAGVPFDPATVWTVIIGLALGSFALRFLFIGMVGSRAMPEWVLRHLRYTAVAVLPALVTPLVIWPAATGGTLDAPRMAAAAVTLAVGYMVKNVLAAIFSGAATLYLLLFLLGG